MDEFKYKLDSTVQVKGLEGIVYTVVKRSKNEKLELRYFVVSEYGHTGWYYENELV